MACCLQTLRRTRMTEAESVALETTRATAKLSPVRLKGNIALSRFTPREHLLRVEFTKKNVGALLREYRDNKDIQGRFDKRTTMAQLEQAFLGMKPLLQENESSTCRTGTDVFGAMYAAAFERVVSDMSIPAQPDKEDHTPVTFRVTIKTVVPHFDYSFSSTKNPPPAPTCEDMLLMARRMCKMGGADGECAYLCQDTDATADIYHVFCQQIQTPPLADAHVKALRYHARIFDALQAWKTAITGAKKRSTFTAPKIDKRVQTCITDMSAVDVGFFVGEDEDTTDKRITTALENLRLDDSDNVAQAYRDLCKLSCVLSRTRAMIGISTGILTGSWPIDIVSRDAPAQLEFTYRPQDVKISDHGISRVPRVIVAVSAFFATEFDDM